MRLRRALRAYEHPRGPMRVRQRGERRARSMRSFREHLDHHAALARLIGCSRSVRKVSARTRCSCQRATPASTALGRERCLVADFDVRPCCSARICNLCLFYDMLWLIKKPCGRFPTREERSSATPSTLVKPKSAPGVSVATAHLLRDSFGAFADLQ
jgi:hypothetical protein